MVLMNGDDDKDIYDDNIVMTDDMNEWQWW